MLLSFLINKLCVLAACPVRVFNVRDEIVFAKLPRFCEDFYLSFPQRAATALQEIRSVGKPVLFAAPQALAGLSLPDGSVLALGSLNAKNDWRYRMLAVNTMLESIHWCAQFVYPQNKPLDKEAAQTILSEMADFKTPRLEDVLPADRHNAYAYELAQLEAVALGEPELYLRNAARSKHGTPGTLAGTPLRSAQNHCICHTVLASRAAIHGGLDVETAYTVADFLILTAERITTEKEGEDLIPKIGVIFASLVRRLRQQLSSSLSALTRQVIAELKRSIYQPLDRAALAERVGRSADYLERRFKQDTGLTIAAFLREERMKVACDLLVNSKLAVSEIASLLTFSSSSHFIKVFRQSRGLTPEQYRQQSQSSLPFLD